MRTISFHGLNTSAAAIAAALLCVANASTAVAQEAASANDKNAVAEGDILVTARRSAESIQSTPVSVTAFDDTALRSAGITKTEDLMIKTPGVYLGGSGGRENSTFQIRGQSKARSGFNSPAVVSYFADVPLPTFGSSVPTFDMASVQVLKGPQGTLFGRNTTGGAVLFYPKQPGYELEGYAQVGYGNYDHRQIEAAISAPIVDGKVAIRVSGMIDKRDGWTKDITYNVRRDGNNAKAFRASVLLEPVEGVKNVTIYDYYTNEYDGDSFVLTGIRPVAPLLPGAFGIRAAALEALARQQARGPRIVESDARPVLETTRQGITNRTDIELGSDVEFTNIFGWRKTHLFYLANSEGLPRLLSSTIPGGTTNVTVLNGNARINTEQVTDEVQLKGSLAGGNIDWLLGGFYLHSKPSGPTGTGSLQFYTGTAPLDMNSFGYNFIVDNSRAVFGSTTFKLDSVVDGLKLNLGARYTWDKLSSCVGTDVTTQGKLLPSDCRNGDPAMIRPSTNRTSSSAPTWQASLEWQANNDLFAYVASRRGYRAGGINSPTLAGRLAPFQTFGPEKVTDVELGFRSDWDLGGEARARLNASAYMAWHQDTAFSLSGVRTGAGCVVGGPAPASPDGDCDTTNDPISGAMTIAAGKTKVSGVDVDGFIALNDAFKFTFAGSLVDPKSVSLNVPAAVAPFVATGTVIGFDFVAKSSYSLGVELNQPLGDSNVRLNADLFHSGKRSFVDAKFPSYSVVNARLAWTDANEALELSLYATNLFDKTYVSQGSFNGPSAGIEASIFGAPRQYGVTARYNF
jgi:iron complex outermembrane recepter protein